MKLKSAGPVLVIAAVSLFVGSVYAGSDDDSLLAALKDATNGYYGSLKQNTISGMASLGSSLATKVPGPFGKAIATYQETMRPEDYASDQSVKMTNAGIVHHFEDERKKDTCFSNLVKEFYSGLKEKKKTSERNVPMIQSKISDLNDPQFKPGWLWEKAMGLTGGNANLAAKVIAYCGHDDMEQADNNVCPKANSPLYYPEALGAGVDTPASIKDYVVRTQSIHISADQIKAKNYHILSAAYLGCRMIENGVPADQVANYSQKFAYIYRRIRTCRSALDTVASYQEAEARYQKKLGQFVKSQSEGKRPTIEEEILQDIPNTEDSFRYAHATDKAKVLKRVVDSYYASKLYTKMTQCPDGKTGEISEAMKANSADGKRLGSDSLYLPPDFDDRCPSIAGGYCLDAKKVLDTWDADFKWTMSQHRVGAEFAAKNCKPLSQQKTPPMCAKSATGAGGGASPTGTR